MSAPTNARTLRSARQRAEEDLLDFLEDSSIAMHWLGPDGVLLRANRAELDMLGYAREEFVGRPMADFHADRGLAADLLSRLAAGEALHGIEARLRCKDGTIKDVLIEASVAWDDEGRFVHARCLLRDVSESHERERTQALLAAIVESSEDAILSKTLDGIVLTWNLGAQRMLGYAPEEVLGRPVTLLVPSDRHEEEASFLERVGRGERVEHYDTVRVAKNGRRVDVSLMLSPVKDRAGRVVAISSIARDVTLRKRTEHRLLTQYEIARVLAESRSLAEAGPRLLQTVCELFDWDAGCLFTVDEEQGVLRCIDVWHPPDESIPHFAEATRSLAFPRGAGLPGRVWQGAAPVWIADVVRDPSFLRAEVARAEGLHGACGFPIVLDERVLGAVEFVSRDVRPPDRDLIQMMAAVGSQTGQFIERKRAEEERNEADRRKDEFLAMLAHELRNPLAPIRNAAQLVGAQTAASPELRWASGMIERQVQQMTRLIDDLLDVSRITRGKITLRKERLDLATVVVGAVEASRPMIAKAGHEFVVSMPQEPLPVEGDSTRLAQIVHNLLNNAAKYTEPGGRVELTVERETRQAVIRVRDNGVGIPREMQPHIFELFTQADRSLERSEGGLGIGLTLVQRLVALHGGAVVAKSDGPGRGSEFVVRLPLAPDAVAEAARPVTRGLPEAPARRHILIVDDNRDSADSLAELLRLRGHATTVAHDGEEALLRVAEGRPDVALLDIGLPRLSGYEVAQRIRGLEGGGDIVLIALTGWGQEEDRRRSRDSGFDYHLTKPIEFQALLQLLSRALAEHPPISVPAPGPAPAAPGSA